MVAVSEAAEEKEAASEEKEAVSEAKEVAEVKEAAEVKEVKEVAEAAEAEDRKVRSNSKSYSDPELSMMATEDTETEVESESTNSQLLRRPSSKNSEWPDSQSHRHRGTSDLCFQEQGSCI